MLEVLFTFFRVSPRRLCVISRRFGTLGSIFIGRWIKNGSNTQTPGIYPKESILLLFILPRVCLVPHVEFLSQRGAFAFLTIVQLGLELRMF
jgi:hypothetical protein